MRGTKLLLGMLVSLVMIMAAMPAIACDQCTRDVPVLSMADVNDMVYQPVMAAPNKMIQPSPNVEPMPAPSLVGTLSCTDAEGTDYATLGGDSLRRTGEPMA